MNDFAVAKQFPLLPFISRRVEQGRKPRKGCDDFSTVCEINDQLVIGDRNIHRARVSFSSQNASLQYRNSICAKNSRPVKRFTPPTMVSSGLLFSRLLPKSVARSRVFGRS